MKELGPDPPHRRISSCNAVVQLLAKPGAVGKDRRVPPVLPSFRAQTVATSQVPIHVRVAGAGPGLLLLHGFPQTGAMWHRIAPALAQDYTVVVADLRGYGASGKPSGKPGGELYAKRVMAQDMVEVMEA